MSALHKKRAGVMGVSMLVLGIGTVTWIQLHQARAGPSGPESESYTLECVSITAGGGALTDPGTGGDRGFGVVGQAAVGLMTGTAYTLDAGIVPCLFRFVRPDFNMDGFVNTDDWDVFEACASGPSVSYSGDCAKADFDVDGDVDQADFAVFQRCYSGDQPARSGCES